MFVINYEDYDSISIKMAFEFVLLLTLIIIFIISFCGLLQKIKQTYQQERIIAERNAQRNAARNQINSISDVFVNPSFVDDRGAQHGESYGGIFPGSPPPYTQTYMEPPPKYEDIFKTVNEVTVPTTEPPRHAPSSNVPAAVHTNHNPTIFATAATCQ